MQSIYSYTKNVLNALDVKWGPAHIGTYVSQYLRTNMPMMYKYSLEYFFCEKIRLHIFFFIFYLNFNFFCCKFLHFIITISKIFYNNVILFYSFTFTFVLVFFSFFSYSYFFLDKDFVFIFIFIFILIFIFI